MARTPVKTQHPDNPMPEPTEAFDRAVAASNELAVMEQTQYDNARAVAREIHYDGELSIGALEDGIRFYQNRTIEACLELGKRLILLKEITPHGEFEERLKMLGIQKRTGQRFMSAAIKFSKASTSTLLKAAKNQSKMLELLVLDDADIDQLKNGETVNGLTLDKIETMSVSELRKALKEAKESGKVKDELLAKKDEKINELDQKLTRKMLDNQDKPAGWEALEDLARLSTDIQATIAAQLRKTILEVLDTSTDENLPDRQLAAAQVVARIMAACDQLTDELNLNTRFAFSADSPARQAANMVDDWLGEDADGEA